MQRVEGVEAVLPDHWTFRFHFVVWSWDTSFFILQISVLKSSKTFLFWHLKAETEKFVTFIEYVSPHLWQFIKPIIGQAASWLSVTLWRKRLTESRPTSGNGSFLPEKISKLYLATVINGYLSEELLQAKPPHNQLGLFCVVLWLD